MGVPDPKHGDDIFYTVVWPAPQVNGYTTITAQRIEIENGVLWYKQATGEEGYVSGTWFVQKVERRT
jgi:hypothetical protein